MRVADQLMGIATLRKKKEVNSTETRKKIVKTGEYNTYVYIRIYAGDEGRQENSERNCYDGQCSYYQRFCTRKCSILNLPVMKKKACGKRA